MTTKYNQPTSFRLPADVNNKLESLCNIWNVTRTQAILRAIRISYNTEIDVTTGEPSCNNCQHLSACRRDVNRVAVVPNEGLVMMPLPCFADHPHYRAEEWRQRQEI